MVNLPVCRFFDNELAAAEHYVMNEFVSVNRAQINRIITTLVRGDRICVKGKWHTVRAMGWPFSYGGDPVLAFEDGGGCLGSAIDALRNASGTYATYAPGMMPANTAD